MRILTNNEKITSLFYFWKTNTGPFLGAQNRPDPCGQALVDGVIIF